MKKTLKKCLLKTISLASTIGIIATTGTAISSASFNGGINPEKWRGVVRPVPKRMAQSQIDFSFEEDSDEEYFREYEKNLQNVSTPTTSLNESSDYYPPSEDDEMHSSSSYSDSYSRSQSCSDSDSELASTSIYKLFPEDIDYEFVNKEKTEIAVSMKKYGFIAPRIEIPEKINVEGRNCTVVSVERQGFYQLEELKEIILPKSIKFIGPEAFAECPLLKRVTVKGNNIVVGVMAFYYCPSLRAVKFYGEVDKICDDAFSTCEQLQYVLFMKNLHKVGDGIFNDCIGPIFIDYYGDKCPQPEGTLSNDMIFDIYVLKDYPGDNFVWHNVNKTLEPYYNY